MFFLGDVMHKKIQMPKPADALPGRDAPVRTAANHFVSGRPLKGPYPEGLETAMLGLGCFWGAERLFWKTEGVWVTAVGYAGGLTPNPTYQETCTGLTGHAEVVLVAFDPQIEHRILKRRGTWGNRDNAVEIRVGAGIDSRAQLMLLPQV